MDLVSRASKLSNELESLRNQADKMQYEHNYQLNKMNKEAESLKQRLRDQTNSNENLEQELNDVQKRKMEQEISWKEERAELERQLNDLKHNLSNCRMTTKKVSKSSML